MNRALYIADGPSDLPLAQHLEWLCRRKGTEVEIVRVPGERLRTRTVAGRLEVLLDEDPAFDMLFVHRDSEDRLPAPRFEEIQKAVNSVGFLGPVVGVVPIRMTEAWLLLDEEAIRQVAGRPNGNTPLKLPKPAHVESIADPKRLLRETLALASEASGRRLKIFQKQFGTHRSQLLERLDPEGPVRELSAWARLESDISGAVTALR